MARSIADALRQPITLKAGLVTAWAFWIEHLGRALSVLTPSYLRERPLNVNVSSADGEQQVRSTIDEATAAARYDRITGTLQLLPEELVCKRIALPAAARGNVVEAASYQIDVETPFTSADVYCGTRVLAGTPTTIAVDISLALRPTVDQLIARIEEFGLPIEKVYGCLPQGEPVLLLARPIERPVKAVRHVLVVSALAASLIAAAVAIPLANKEFEADRLRRQAELDLQMAAPIIAAQRKLNISLESKAEVAKVVQRFPDPVQVLAALTESVPSDTWLTRFAMRDGEVQISGLTPSTSALIDDLAQTDVFFPPAYAAPAIRDPQFDRERFVLNLRLRPSL